MSVGAAMGAVMAEATRAAPCQRGYGRRRRRSCTDRTQRRPGGRLETDGQKIDPAGQRGRRARGGRIWFIHGGRRLIHTGQPRGRGGEEATPRGEGRTYRPRGLVVRRRAMWRQWCAGMRALVGRHGRGCPQRKWGAQHRRRGGESREGRGGGSRECQGAVLRRRWRGTGGIGPHTRRRWGQRPQSCGTGVRALHGVATRGRRGHRVTGGAAGASFRPAVSTRGVWGRALGKGGMGVRVVEPWVGRDRVTRECCTEARGAMERAARECATAARGGRVAAGEGRAALEKEQVAVEKGRAALGKG
jgi:hypothetical protein